MSAGGLNQLPPRRQQSLAGFPDPHRHGPAAIASRFRFACPILLNISASQRFRYDLGRTLELPILIFQGRNVWGGTAARNLELKKRLLKVF